MAQQDRDTLKSYVNTGDKPTESQLHDWVDSFALVTELPVGGDGGIVSWGNITGTLEDQTDLQSALDEKPDASSLAAVATTGAYADLTGKPDLLSNDAGNTLTDRPKFWVGTQADYDAIPTKDPNTIYDTVE